MGNFRTILLHSLPYLFHHVSSATFCGFLATRFAISALAPLGSKYFKIAFRSAVAFTILFIFGFLVPGLVKGLLEYEHVDKITIGNEKRPLPCRWCLGPRFIEP